jgi:hypothetical protein
LLGEEIAINVLIAVLKENRFSAISPLRHMMGQVGNHDAGKASHA